MKQCKHKYKMIGRWTESSFLMQVFGIYQLVTAVECKKCGNYEQIRERKFR